MKNCTLVSSCNAKGFGLDSITLLIDYNEYRYLVSGVIREKIERIDLIGRRPFDMVNVAKKHGIFIKDCEYFIPNKNMSI